MLEKYFQFVPAVLLLLTGIDYAGFCHAQSDAMYEQPPINYSTREPIGPVAELQRKLDSGEVQFTRTNEKAFLQSLLNYFQIPVESQVLVFSKTSHQNSMIHPETPRAIYFNDNVYLGWVQGGQVEIADMSPGIGMTFYLLDHRKPILPIRFNRTESCLDCHAGSRVDGMPGMMVRSVYPSGNGLPVLNQGSFETTHASPINERWGGWYVSGTHGDTLHMGNTIAIEDERGDVAFDMKSGTDVMDLSSYFNTRPYLTDSSDIVALMVLEHQCEMQNLLSRAASFTRLAIHRQAEIRKALGEPEINDLVGTSLTVAKSHVEKILKYMLFSDEIRLPDGGIRGREEFKTGFQRNAKPDSEGRSLKDFQLEERLFKYRCSYMIYSAAFEDLPSPQKRMVYTRLFEILNGRDTSEVFNHLGRAERKAIREIMIATKDDLPDLLP